MLRFFSMVKEKELFRLSSTDKSGWEMTRFPRGAGVALTDLTLALSPGRSLVIASFSS
ncbi:hypothetical protein [Halobacillus massiliensis]|uniref:hypothetical protein n=1 Tax=Halobacillus massiliensis TaxID=1926286 RepID=UPI0015C4A560|nr:hypothetical protein [Halobacillus massiliensis]